MTIQTEQQLRDMLTSQEQIIDVLNKRLEINKAYIATLQQERHLLYSLKLKYESAYLKPILLFGKYGIGVKND